MRMAWVVEETIPKQCSFTSKQKRHLLFFFQEQKKKKKIQTIDHHLILYIEKQLLSITLARCID